MLTSVALSLTYETTNALNSALERLSNNALTANNSSQSLSLAQSENELHLFFTKIAIDREESNSIVVFVSWECRGNDFVVFAEQFPYFGDCVAEL